jgi:phosphoenolpyruvate carboxylase
MAGRIQSLFSAIEKELKDAGTVGTVVSSSFCNHPTGVQRKTVASLRILARIDAHLSQTDEHRIDFNTVNIEHILHSGSTQGLKLTKKDIKDYVNRLGNLTLVSMRINSKVQNTPVDQKLPELANSGWRSLSIWLRVFGNSK